MGLGVLEPKVSQILPSTVIIEELEEDILSSRQHGRTKIILEPGQRNSSLDPSSWSSLKKELLFLVILLGTCGAGVVGPLLVPAFNIISVEFNISLTKVTLLNGSLIMALGVSSYLSTALAVIYGKRLIFLTTTFLLIISTIWGGISQNYNALLASRVFQGMILLLSKLM
jgi:hypothetical protein